MSDHARLEEKLREQLRFLQRSCVAFDNGAEDEALRMATALRVILHSTKQSVPLVSHLGLTNGMLLSSSRGIGDYNDYLSHVLNINSPTPVRMVPLLGDKFHELPFEKWWRDETVFIDGREKYFRKTIILSAANKDGGAHVDRQLERYYEILCSGKYAFGLTGNLTFNGPAPFEQGVTYYAKNAHLALIRQFSHEILASAVQFRWVSCEAEPKTSG
jgi:hypothetical protein